MMNSGLRALLKLSLLVSAFSLYPSTEGTSLDEETDELLSVLEDVFTSRLQCPSTVSDGVQNCVVDLAESTDEPTTEEECQSVLQRVGQCLFDGLDACGVHPRLRAAVAVYYNREISQADCFERRRK